MGLGSPTQLSEHSQQHVFYNEPFLLAFWCYDGVVGFAFLLRAQSGEPHSHGWHQSRCFFPQECRAGCFPRALCTQSLGQGPAGGSQAGGMAPVPSQCLQTPSSKGLCSFSSWRPEHLRGSQTHCLNRRNEMRGRGSRGTHVLPSSGKALW